MMALVDSIYRFLYVDVGCNGRVSDGGVFRGSTLQESLEQRTANIPQPTPLPGTDMTMPFFVVADEAFLPGEGFPENRESSTTGYSVPAVLLKTPSASLRTDLVFLNHN